jgi:hypothetical protein
MRKRHFPAGLPVPLAMIGGGFVHSLLPLGLFAPHDILFRALLTGVVTAGVALILLAVGSETKGSSLIAPATRR